MCLSSPKTPAIAPAPPPPPAPNAVPDPVDISNGGRMAEAFKRRKAGRNGLRIGLGIPGGDSGTGLSIPTGV